MTLEKNAILSGISTPKKGEGAWLWLLKIVSGLLVVALLMVHLVVNHLVGVEGLLTFDEIVAYLSNPWIAFMESTFLVLVVVHALVGTRSILLDLNPSPLALRFINWLFSIVGVVSIAYGIWLIQAIVAQAPAG